MNNGNREIMTCEEINYKVIGKIEGKDRYLCRDSRRGLGIEHPFSLIGVAISCRRHWKNIYEGCETGAAQWLWCVSFGWLA